VSALALIVGAALDGRGTLTVELGAFAGLVLEVVIEGRGVVDVDGITIPLEVVLDVVTVTGVVDEDTTVLVSGKGSAVLFIDKIQHG